MLTKWFVHLGSGETGGNVLSLLGECGPLSLGAQVISTLGHSQSPLSQVAPGIETESGCVITELGHPRSKTCGRVLQNGLPSSHLLAGWRAVLL